MRFFRLQPETPFLGKFAKKYQNDQFKLRFGTYSNSKMQNSMVVFTFSVLDCEQPFWANLITKIKIASLR